MCVGVGEGAEVEVVVAVVVMMPAVIQTVDIDPDNIDNPTHAHSMCGQGSHCKPRVSNKKKASD